VVTKPVPAGATAVGNPARIIQAEADAKREEAASKMGFSAYGVTQSDDPLNQAMRGLIDNAATHEQQIALLWRTIETMQANCIPQEASRSSNFEADKLNQLVGK
jgi:serine O-acetyltransferase